MITHIVFFKLKDASPGNIEKTRNVLQGLDGNVPQLRNLEVGVDVIHSERSYDIALVARFDSLEDLNAYQTDPVHVKVGEFINSVKESAVAVDYESGN